MAKLEIDNMEYSSDILTQDAYVTSDAVNLVAYSESTIKTQGDYSLKAIASTSALSAMFTKSFSPTNDLTNVKDLKFDIRSSRTGSNIKLELYSGSNPTGGTITNDEYDTETGLILHYKLNDNDSNTLVTDSSPSNNTGTSMDNTDVMTVPGKINSALNFGALGVINPVTLTNRIVFGDYATVNCWVYNYSMFSSFAGNSDQGVARYLYWYSDGNIYLGSNTFPEQVNWPAIDFTGWHMITIIKNQNIVELLIDKVSQGQRILTTLADITQVGAGFTDWMHNCALDDFRVYNRILTNKEISVLYTGTESSVNNPASNTIHTFTSDGIFLTSNDLTSDVLVVAGGGGGGAGASSPGNGGGGGAGGLIYDEGYTIPAGRYTVQVGDGGNPSSDGEDSSINDLVAIGGGTGGIYAGGGGANGGSGGGAGQSPYNGIGLGTLGQGNDGGGANLNNYGGGGGGGAGEVGHDPINVNGFYENGGAGGDGLEINITGIPTYYAGGGGGSTHGSGDTQSIGGLGGGGRGSFNGGATAGVNGLGGGGGSGGEYYEGMAGGSGIVIIKYPISVPLLVAEITPNIIIADQWQTVRWNISDIPNIDKNNITSLKITIVNADVENTFYIDNFNIFPQTYDVVGVIE